jgi:AcrR family transcriptional regulator
MSRTKRSYHHGDLRRALMHAALDVVRDGGVAALSLREAARRAGVSSAAPYHHFESREALVGALCNEGFAMLAARGEVAMREAGGDALTKLRALGRSYVNFARENPAYFRLMFTAHTTPPASDEAATLGSLYQLVDAVKAAQAAGQAPRGDAMPWVLLAWSVVHGLATLAIEGPLSQQVWSFPRDAASLDATAIDALITLMRNEAPR